eukprot:5188124-Amphidinium_carterae.1
MSFSARLTMQSEALIQPRLLFPSQTSPALKTIHTTRQRYSPARNVSEIWEQATLVEREASKYLSTDTQTTSEERMRIAFERCPRDS